MAVFTDPFIPTMQVPFEGTAREAVRQALVRLRTAETSLDRLLVAEDAAPFPAADAYRAVSQGVRADLAFVAELLDAAVAVGVVATPENVEGRP
ncbi:hypothetical protein [Gordonia malaquae]|uniref:hypothetical protein n=1 Tax=Gordonia malaquae TaxID=410332 RepID=UPI0030FDFC08